MSHERWADVPGWEGIYRISDQGTVIRLERRVATRKGRGPLFNLSEREVTYQNNHGFAKVTLNDPETGRRRIIGVHLLVFLAFEGSMENLRNIWHDDGNRWNNALNNLRWNVYGDDDEHAPDPGRRRRFEVFYGGTHTHPHHNASQEATGERKRA